MVKPITEAAEESLRYGDWELSRRETVEALGQGELGYIHLRAMGKNDIAQWAREFYPVFNRKGLIIDVRHNRGGNIDSWILEKLLRKAWFYWQGRAGIPTWNMQYAFRGHIVVLCNEHTASDGEAFTEGFKRLGLGKVIGKQGRNLTAEQVLDALRAQNIQVSAGAVGQPPTSGDALMQQQKPLLNRPAPIAEISLYVRV